MQCRGVGSIAAAATRPSRKPQSSTGTKIQFLRRPQEPDEHLRSGPCWARGETGTRGGLPHTAAWSSPGPCGWRVRVQEPRDGPGCSRAQDPARCGAATRRLSRLTRRAGGHRSWMRYVVSAQHSTHALLNALSSCRSLADPSRARGTGQHLPQRNRRCPPRATTTRKLGNKSRYGSGQRSVNRCTREEMARLLPGTHELHARHGSQASPLALRTDIRTAPAPCRAAWGRSRANTGRFICASPRLARGSCAPVGKQGKVQRRELRTGTSRGTSGPESSERPRPLCAFVLQRVWAPVPGPAGLPEPLGFVSVRVQAASKELAGSSYSQGTSPRQTAVPAGSRCCLPPAARRGAARRGAAQVPLVLGPALRSKPLPPVSCRPLTQQADLRRAWLYLH